MRRSTHSTGNWRAATRTAIRRIREDSRSCAALAIAAAVAGPALLSAQFLATPPGPPVDPNAQFEAASVKAFDNSASGPVRLMMMPGRLEANGVPLRLLLRQALRVQDYQIVGAPDWVNTERYTVVAKMPDGAPPNASPVMLTNLFKDRFKLVTHAETREMPIFNLVLARPDGKLGAASSRRLAECQARDAGTSWRTASGGPGWPRPGPAVRVGQVAGRAAAGRRRRRRLQPSRQPCGIDTHRAGAGWRRAASRSRRSCRCSRSSPGRPVYDKTGLTGHL